MLTLFLFTVFPLLVIGAAVSDLFTMTIPNPISFLLVAGFLAAALLTGLTGQEIVLQLGCAMAVLVIGFTFFALGWIGGGDAKLAAAITLWLELRQSPRLRDARCGRWRHSHDRDPLAAHSSPAGLRARLELAYASA